ncbi:MAG: RNA polymerase sporulation sigma factor SigF [Lachnospiraceae bacterium]|nr:RNA polymerase sporulation sigma factor SigF [Lachnospiraceae bacterium]
MDTIELIKLAGQGNHKAREEIITKNMALVWSIVRRFSNRGYEPEDLFQIGCIGLVKAVDKFDLSFDVKFSTYAVPMIIGEIKRFIRDDGLVKVSRSIKENSIKISHAKEAIMHRENREATVNEIAEMTGLSVEDVIIAADAAVPVESIYNTVYQSDGEDIYVIDRLSVTGESEKIINHLLLDKLISELAENERFLIKMRYFQDKTQAQVAELLGISQVQVSRMEKKVLLKMRKCAACE